MKTNSVWLLEAAFILAFGVFHFAIPFIFPAKANVTINLFVNLHIADFVLPGCFLLATVSIVFVFTKNRYPAAILVFLYGGGIVFHALFLSGILPPVIVVPNSSAVLAGGIVIDALSIAAVYDFHRRSHLPKATA